MFSLPIYSRNCLGRKKRKLMVTVLVLPLISSSHSFGDEEGACLVRDVYGDCAWPS